LRSVIKLFRIEQVFQLFLTPAQSGEGFSDFRRSFRLALPNRIFKMAANEPVFRDQSGAPCKRLSHDGSIKWTPVFYCKEVTVTFANEAAMLPGVEPNYHVRIKVDHLSTPWTSRGEPDPPGPRQ
jgi:hypothetical protein